MQSSARVSIQIQETKPHKQNKIVKGFDSSRAV